ncbi:MAG: heme-dependent peroxidase [Verrucomicrobia bacterium]|nr:heme-dependent peroxidase [Verrucomicrobiota bacterium]
MTSTTLRPKEGWHVLHLFYRIEYASWRLLSKEEQIEAKTTISALVQQVRAAEETQLLTFSVVSPKADLGFMLLTPDLHYANAVEKKLSLSLGDDVLSPVFSFYSLTERSEYTTTEEEYRASLTAEKSPEEIDGLMHEFVTRMDKYLRDRLYPNVADWPVLCFYPMNKRRGEQENWYRLSFEERKQLMSGHARVGRQYAGRVRQLITGATGLDDWEWGVTLLAHDIFEVKSIVYEMRFDEVSARFAEFGEFFIGLQLPLDQLFQRLLLS